jgi:hypothetical protein
MAKDELTGNMPMENMVFYFHSKGYTTNVNPGKLQEALLLVPEIFDYGI